jgi:hypothetical protein
MQTDKRIIVIRKWLIFFMITLFFSGLTAIPLEKELAFLSRITPYGSQLDIWIERVYQGVVDTNASYPFMAYGYDWLAFAHFVLAILFIGPYKDPVRNKWVIEFGVIACLLIIPFAFIAGHFRDIPMGWRLIDSAFGVFGLIPLRICLNRITEIEKVQKEEERRNSTDYLLFNH